LAAAARAQPPQWLQQPARKQAPTAPPAPISPLAPLPAQTTHGGRGAGLHPGGGGPPAPPPLPAAPHSSRFTWLRRLVWEHDDSGTGRRRHGDKALSRSSSGGGTGSPQPRAREPPPPPPPLPPSLLHLGAFAAPCALMAQEQMQQRQRQAQEPPGQEQLQLRQRQAQEPPEQEQEQMQLQQQQAQEPPGQEQQEQQLDPEEPEDHTPRAVRAHQQPKLPALGAGAPTAASPAKPPLHPRSPARSPARPRAPLEPGALRLGAAADGPSLEQASHAGLSPRMRVDLAEVIVGRDGEEEPVDPPLAGPAQQAALLDAAAAANAVM
jgi:TolA-binding protein